MGKKHASQYANFGWLLVLTTAYDTLLQFFQNLSLLPYLSYTKKNTS